MLLSDISHDSISHDSYHKSVSVICLLYESQQRTSLSRVSPKFSVYIVNAKRLGTDSLGTHGH